MFLPVDVSLGKPVAQSRATNSTFGPLSSEVPFSGGLVPRHQCPQQASLGGVMNQTATDTNQGRPDTLCALRNPWGLREGGVLFHLVSTC